MKPTILLTAVSSAILLSACSAFGAHDSSAGSDSSGANAVQWKQVTRNVGGNVVTYNVPAGRQVDSLSPERLLPTYDPQKKGAQSSAVPTEKAAVAVQARQATADVGLPAARFPHEPGADRIAANATTRLAEPSSNISLDAETALGQAEIVVRDAQNRFETAQGALKRAREAARSGDSTSVIKFSKTAQALAHPGP